MFAQSLVMWLAAASAAGPRTSAGPPILPGARRATNTWAREMMWTPSLAAVLLVALASHPGGAVGDAAGQPEHERWADSMVRIAEPAKSERRAGAQMRSERQKMSGELFRAPDLPSAGMIELRSELAKVKAELTQLGARLDHCEAGQEKIAMVESNSRGALYRGTLLTQGSPEEVRGDLWVRRALDEAPPWTDLLPDAAALVGALTLRTPEMMRAGPGCTRMGRGDVRPSTCGADRQC